MYNIQDSDTVCPYIKQTLCWYCGCAALTQAKQLVIVVGSPDAVKIAVEAEKSDQCMSTLQQRITAVAIKAGRLAIQTFTSVSFHISKYQCSVVFVVVQL